MNATKTQRSCEVRIDWRDGSRQRYRRTNLDEIRGWIERRSVTPGLGCALTATTPVSEVVLGADLRVWWYPQTGTAQYWLQSDEQDAFADFVAITERLLGGETAESILETYQ
jgi:hypothetical protein